MKWGIMEAASPFPKISVWYKAGYIVRISELWDFLMKI